MKSKIFTNVAKTATKAKNWGIKRSPEILMVTAVIGVVGAMIEVAHATTKLDEILEPAKEKIADIHEAHENPQILPDDAVYTDKDYRRDLALTYFQTGWKLTKLYFPSVLIGSLSIACIVGGHNIMAQRNLMLASAYEACDRAFKSYRERVAERYGKEAEKEIRYDLKTKQIEEETVDEDGKVKKTKKKEAVMDGNLNDYSEYAFFFDESCEQWEDDAEYNKSFLVRAQDAFNQRFKALDKGEFISLNEFHDYVGKKRTKAGQFVGWIKGDDEYADDYIDFGIFDVRRPRVADFINGYEKSIILDPNVSVIANQIR